MHEYLEAVHVLNGVTAQNKHLDEFEMKPFCQQICYGVSRNYYSLGYLTSNLVNKPLPAKHHDLFLLLLAGLYSIDNLHRPVHTSVNAAVEATVGLKKPWAKGLINGVLRRYIRERDTLPKPDPNENSEAHFNHPHWLIEAISNAWPEHPEIFSNNNMQAPLTLRVNALQTSRDGYLQNLEDRGLKGTMGALTPSAVVLAKAVPVSELPGFSEGLVSVQDEAPQLAATFLNLTPGLRVLDACAAPGGKTCHILEVEPAVELTAIDKDSKRLQKIEDNLNRLNLTCELRCSALENYAPEQEYDRILLDVPCSASGIIRRHPDIKLLRRKPDVDKLSITQRALLNKAFDLLRTGGELLYSTCSILPQENDQVVSQFLSSTPNAVIEKIDFKSDSSIATTAGGLQLFPTKDQHDGFFYARLRKVDVSQ